ncbi:hypothetical protein VN1288_13620 [Helicobacter pylori]|nr:hypothetical protein VN1288_13620 [Helicobacter pylori]
MLIPFLKISAHYSASDRVGKVRKIKIKKRKQWGLAKKSNPPKKRILHQTPPKKREFKKSFKKTKNLKTKSSKKRKFKKKV